MEEIGYTVLKPASIMRKNAILSSQSTDKKELIEELVTLQMKKIEDKSHLITNNTQTECIIYDEKYREISSEVERLFKSFGYVISKDKVAKEYKIYW